MKNKRVLITGGAGFIGSSLARELVADNDVIVIDNLSTGKEENISDLIGKGLTFIKGSITDLNLLREAFKNVDFVFHQAAIPSVSESVEDPLATNEVNATGTLNVLIAAKDNKVKKVLYASSCSVYGDVAVLPVREDMIPNPLSPYAVTKLSGEYYCRVFQAIYNLSTVCLRYFNVYGPRQDPESPYSAAVPRFIKDVLQGKPPVIFGDGEQSRDFIFVNDVVKANILAAESEATGIFNIGTGHSTTIDKLAKLIIGIFGKTLEPIYQEPREGDIKHSVAEISKAGLIGYKPMYDIERGLTETIKEST
ncbi:SDR family oxidoreductase [Chloroflexota bacterium]